MTVRSALGVIFLFAATAVAPAQQEERFISINLGYYSGSSAGESAVFGGGYAVKMFGRAVLSADIGVKTVSATIFGVPGNEITWIDLGASARYLLAKDADLTPYIGAAVGYGPVTVDDRLLRPVGITVSGSTSCYSLTGLGGLRWDIGSGLAFQLEGRYMTAGFPIEGSVKQNINLNGFEALFQTHIRI